jgi:molybdopterin synthase catalytic subunit
MMPELLGPHGRLWCCLSKSSIDPDPVQDWLVDPTCGAVVTFVGRVRNHSGRRSGVSSIFFESFRPAALDALDRIGREVFDRWPHVAKLALIHREGQVGVGEVTVVVGAASPHRAEAFESVAWSMEAIKEMVPVWKLEKWVDGQGPALDSRPIRWSVGQAQESRRDR